MEYKVNVIVRYSVGLRNIDSISIVKVMYNYALQKNKRCMDSINDISAFFKI